MTLTDQPFLDLTSVTRVPAEHPDGTAAWQAHIDPVWTIGPKVHGGCMLAVCASAARRSVLDAGVDPLTQPLAVSASFVAAPDPGDVELTTVLRKQGKQIALVDVELSQAGRVAVRASVTLGTPDTEEPFHTVPHRATTMPADPPAESVLVTPEHPMGQIVKFAATSHLRIDSATARFLDGQQGEPLVSMWTRPSPGDEADVDTSVLFALMCGDVSAPVAMNLGRFGWAPTVQLTAYLRRVPAPGWLRVIAESSVLGSTWFEEDHTVVDSTGQVVVQSRQLAMMPR
ncbi:MULTISPECIES: thioesterase family protein [Rhodococcus]|uniref:thioesterase family protein n=1 Tax=Rhodococcus TaxID=1827 RepID=UPI001E3C0837|nr:thioesterase family protein [Rhodococcus pyridinivorans]MCD2116369.1 thioesterase family protein [Rhodococcus pyridinivorans]MCZ4625237.1 thioesterase family protein [Rhodococcus pyridinivorans]MCZ4646244.1 thioesterase family protein [Rhodococcus pyridinivorans]MDJ0480725.1 thioesterase family protein [Rhodococcus pyridinivorans]MDV7252550.1 thioesterase family protein [Rhodococcus pyridinivorans]